MKTETPPYSVLTFLFTTLVFYPTCEWKDFFCFVLGRKKSFHIPTATYSRHMQASRSTSDRLYRWADVIHLFMLRYINPYWNVLTFCLINIYIFYRESFWSRGLNHFGQARWGQRSERQRQHQFHATTLKQNCFRIFWSVSEFLDTEIHYRCERRRRRGSSGREREEGQE